MCVYSCETGRESQRLTGWLSTLHLPLSSHLPPFSPFLPSDAFISFPTHPILATALFHFHLPSLSFSSFAVSLTIHLSVRHGPRQAFHYRYPHTVLVLAAREMKQKGGEGRQMGRERKRGTQQSNIQKSFKE